MTEHARVLSLQEVAAWQFPEILKTPEERVRLSEFHPGIPSLQRGAVWKPRQIEFLWDSLMRGFPIGSFVVCDRIAGQNEHGGQYAVENSSTRFTHHLLDGQQRANGIALGFVDQSASEGPHTACLWLDLLAKPQEARRFLFRVTTLAHPWGYDKDDASSRLRVDLIRNAVDPSGREFSLHDTDAKGKYGYWPIDAILPIPVTWLLKDAPNLLSEESFRDWLKGKIQNSKEQLKKRFSDCLEQHEKRLDTALVNRLQKAMQRLREAQFVALEVSPGILEDTDGEQEVSPANTESERAPISNVEHLFTRLNSAGTNLDGTELAYSLIKAYWPEIEVPISKLPRFDNEARLASLAFRHALSNEGELSSSLKIPAIRRLAVRGGEEANKVRILLGLDSSRPEAEALPEFQKRLEELVHRLGWSESRKFGLHKFLICDIFRRNQELVLLLLELASRMDTSDESHRCFLGLATALHWFSGETEGDRREAAKLALEKVGSGKLNAASFRSVLAKNQHEGRGSIPLIPPSELERLLPEFEAANEASLKDWNFWNALPILEGDSIRRHWPFVQRLKDLKQLLLYSQRDMISRLWSDYDPTNVQLWEDHDRPWDYDHLLPHEVLYNRKQSNLPYKKAGDRWLNTIGNYRAWPFEANRSRQNQQLTDLDEAERSDSLLAPADPDKYSMWPSPQAFCLKTEAFREPANAVRFMNAARQRMVSMYRDWYVTLGIGFLMDNADSQSPEMPGNNV